MFHSDRAVAADALAPDYQILVVEKLFTAQVTKLAN
jgi:hypothetical protein